MKKSEFDRIKRGAILQNEGSGESYIVVRTHRRQNTDDPSDWTTSHFAIRTIMIMNPDEWKLIKP